MFYFFTKTFSCTQCLLTALSNSSYLQKVAVNTLFVFSDLVFPATKHIFENTSIQHKPGTLDDRWQPMTIQLDADFAVRYRCHWVADANFAIGARRCIGYSNDATNVDSQSMLVEGG
jgi:hypothetical protein